MQKDIKEALKVLREGGVILYPTDTIWGLGCDACNEKAVQKIYDIKKRADSKSMLCLVDNPSKLDIYIKEVPEVAWDLIEENSGKPLTIIYPSAKNLAKNLVAQDGSIGIRVIKEPFCEKLIAMLRNPLVSTSANISGEPAPQSFQDISKEIIEAVDYVVTYRQDDTNKAQASSILKLSQGGLFEIIRD